MFTPRSDTVLRRWRNGGGRASGARCVAPFWWPFEWQSSRAKAGHLRAAILGRIELLLREGRQQQAQPFQLPGSEKAIEQLVIMGERDQSAPIHESRLRLGYLLKARRSAGRWWSSDNADWKSVVVTWSGRRWYWRHFALLAKPAGSRQKRN